MAKSNNASNSNLMGTLTIIAVIIVAVLIGMYIADKKEETPGEKISEAIRDVGDSIEDSAKDMQDRSPAEKVGDAVEDAGEAIQDSAH